jgi:Uma2 family endonuclease
MTAPIVENPRLITGTKFDLDDFLALCEEVAYQQRAELIDGIVFVPDALWSDHIDLESSVTVCMGQYADVTPGCQSGRNATCVMLAQSPRPDLYLRIGEEYGGNSRLNRGVLEGAPELVAEICATSTEIDFGPKLELYMRAGVREYITFETLPPRRIVWRILVDGIYHQILPDASGIIRSHCFPGLWLDTEALWAGDGIRKQATVRAGLESDEHRAFVEQLEIRIAK